MKLTVPRPPAAPISVTTPFISIVLNRSILANLERKYTAVVGYNLASTFWRRATVKEVACH